MKYYSINRPFWLYDEYNKPSKDLFTKWIKENMVVFPEDVSVNYLTNTTIEVVSKWFNSMKYISIDGRYFYQTNIRKIAGSGIIVYTFEMDVYCTYVMEFIEKTKGEKFIFNRVMDWSEDIRYEDDFITNYEPKIKGFKGIATPIPPRDYKITGEDLILFNKYYVFSDGVNNSYSFFPILSKSKKSTINYYDTIEGEIDKSKYVEFRNFTLNDWEKYNQTGGYLHTYTKVYTDNLDEAMEFYNKYNINGNVHYEFVGDPWDQGHINYLNSLIKNKLDKSTKPIDIKFKDYYKLDVEGQALGSRLKLFISNTATGEVIDNSTGTWYGGNLGTHYRRIQALHRLRLRIYAFKPKNVTNSKTLYNTEEVLFKMYQEQGFSQRFKGIYYLPNLYNIQVHKKIYEYNNKSMLYLEIGQNGVEINNLQLLNLDKAYLSPQINMNKFYYNNLLNFLDVKYYGSSFNAYLRVDDMGNVVIPKCKLIFLDKAYLITGYEDINNTGETNLKRLNKNNHIIEFPYMLPSVSNEYKNYVLNNKNVSEVGYQIEKQKMTMGVIGGTLKTASSAAMIGLGGLQTQTLYAANPWLSDTGVIGQNKLSTGAAIGGGIAGGIMNIASSIIDFQNWVKQEKLKYQQAHLQLSNNINYSSTNDAANMIYDNITNVYQYEPIEINILYENDIINLNNHWYLNGFINPHLNSFNNINFNNFYFYQLDADYLKTFLSTHYNYLETYDNERIGYIVETLIKGVRIWKYEPKDVINEK